MCLWWVRQWSNIKKIRRIQAINDTKIKYLLVADKIYNVTDINFCNLTIVAIEADLTITDIAENEFKVEDFSEFYIVLHNLSKNATAIDFVK